MISQYLKNLQLRARWALWFSVANALLATLIGLRYLSVANVTLEPEVLAFLSTYWLGHFSLLAFVAWFLVIIPLAFIITAAGVFKLLAVVIASLATTALVVDTFVYIQYRFHINSFIFDLLMNDRDGHVFSFSVASWLMGIAIVAVIIMVQLLFTKQLWKMVNSCSKTPLRWMFASVFVFSFFGSHFTHIWADANGVQSITRYGFVPPVAFPATAYGFMEKQGWVNPEARQQKALFLQDKEKQSLRYPIASLSCQLPAKPMNLLLITIDTWRMDAMNPKATPNLFRFSERSTEFKNHFSGSNGTRTGIFSLFYGLPGHYWETMKGSRISPVLMDQLMAEGYDMGIFSSARLDNPRFHETVFNNLQDLRLSSEGSSPHERDANLTDDWLKWVDNRDPETPFFGFLFYDAPHGVSHPQDYPKVFDPEWETVNQMLLNDDFDPIPYLNRYLNSVHYTDSQIGRVLEQLSEKGMLANTVVAITGDHGEEFNDNGKGYWGHNGNFSRYQTQVPMILYWPELSANKVTHITSHYDLAPTFLSRILGCNSPASDYSIGQDLLVSENRKPWLLMGSHNKYAIVEPNQITEIDPIGNYQVFTPDYEMKGNTELDAGVMFEAMSETTRFFKR
ncbi:DUF3413 domain-containing protein [Motiliproteus sp. MSK22-1]|uniref:DUF3413 domain-containing protein n=1 Tax=Motiliproteus sp. MSK22-1 TaxID=1897630 RepID=UPI000975D0F6|nr:DUF3413 domain-containing protein [Motiliproteus sp. MSK22-1]OMH25557.1 hypothetical protein BGP75_23650 [Motiliproteus sp. MSK22-1]